ncbi:MAG: DUF4174 domain-containing protein [Planktomarina sp.]
MKRRILFTILTAVYAHTAWADDLPPPLPAQNAQDVVLADYQWVARPIVVFADSPRDPRFIEQMEYLSQNIPELTERDIVVITDTDPSAASALRTDLRPRGFSMVLIGKDGTVKLRNALPWDIREINRVIDKMPLRQIEIEDARKQRAP